MAQVICEIPSYRLHEGGFVLDVLIPAGVSIRLGNIQASVAVEAWKGVSKTIRRVEYVTSHDGNWVTRYVLEENIRAFVVEEQHAH